MTSRFWRAVKTGDHLGDDVLSRLVGGDLSGSAEARARHHLSKCWKCRSRHEELERVALAFADLHRRLVEPHLPQSPTRRDLFIARLDQIDEPAFPMWPDLRSRIHLPRVPMNSMLASSLVAAAAIVIIFLIWQRPVPSVSAAELLTRAESWESGSSRSGEPGVLYRRIRISTPHRSVERDMYSDREGRRHPKSAQLGPELGSLAPKLAAAGISLDEPLSAAAYKDWRDRQRVKTDKVERSGDKLLTLTTTTQSSLVTQESLTVREDDFRPVRRTVELEDTGTVEIAELHYAEMSWSAVNPALFEPAVSVAILEAGPAVIPASVPSSVQPGPAIESAEISLPTPAQLDSSELQTLVMLNHLDADTAEQIRVTRSDTTVDVIGLVETEQRKREIATGLRGISHVTCSIHSVEQLSQHPPTGSDITSVQAYSFGDQRFPLQDYLKQAGVTRADLSQLTQRLLDAALTAQQKTTGLTSLLHRFPEPDRLTIALRSDLEHLALKYASGIEASLDAEVATLHELGLAGTTDSVKAGSAELVREVQRNQSLCQELVATTSSNSRPAPAIASDLLNSAARIRAALRQLSIPVKATNSAQATKETQ